MSQSMTGFARSNVQNSELNVVWEVRSVNHRYLEMQFRIPEALRSAEHELRELVRNKLKRGKVDLALKYEYKLGSGSELKLNPSLVQQLFHLQDKLKSHQQSLAGLTSIDILRYPGVLQEEEKNSDSLIELSKQALVECLDKLIIARESEGKRVTEFIQDRVILIKEHVNAIRKAMPEIRQRIKDKTLTRLADLEQKPDQDRLEQEMVYLVQKMDVDEELDRLDSHIAELEKTLKASASDGRNDAIGRRLDFLMQEFNREANTLASKSQNSSTTQHAVELKVLIEQMREQIQNIE